MRGPSRPWPSDREPVYVWDVVVRGTHWAVVLSIVLLSATGIYIGHPFTFGSAAGHGGAFAMGWAKILHFYAAIVFSIAVLARIVWMFVGPRRSGWRQFIPTTERRRRGVIEAFKFYAFFRKEPPETIGHNPLAGLAYIAIFGLYIFMILTGFALYSVSSYSFMRTWDFLLVVFGGVQWTRWFHHATMWIILIFVVQHVYSSLLTASVERNGTMDSIFSGFKFLRRDRKADDAE